MILSLKSLTRWTRIGALLAVAATGISGQAAAQAIDVQQWQGTNARTRQPEQVIANTMAEWRSLWSLVGMAPPDLFEPGRTEAVGIFLGGRASDGHSVNILSAARRRDRIIVVFEERAPSNVMTAQSAPTTRSVSTGSSAMGFAAGGGPAASLPPIPYRPAGPPTSPWAILLLGRADLPVTVEQRLFLR
ncbi:MAG: hypothetical protein JSR24_21875 [Proteobacteria bacterium]|nr:hypothetical protein [Pseudomonadota bacterium]